MQPIPIHSQQSSGIEGVKQSGLDQDAPKIEGSKSFFGRAIAQLKTHDLSPQVLQSAKNFQSKVEKAGREEQFSAMVERLSLSVPKSGDLSAPEVTVLLLSFLTSGKKSGQEEVDLNLARQSMEMVDQSTRNTTASVPLDSTANIQAKKDFQKDISSLEEQAEKIKAAKTLPKDVRQAILDTLNNQIANLKTHISYLDQTLIREPMSKGKVAEARIQWLESGVEVVDSLKRQAPLGKQAELDSLRKVLTDAIGKEKLKVGNNEPYTGDTTRNISNLPGAINRLIQARMERMGLSPQQLDPVKYKGVEELDFKTALESCHAKVLNKSGWNEIHTQIQVGHKGVPKSFGNTISPANTLGNVFDSSYQKGEGISSGSSSEKEHSVNLARTTLQDSSGKTIFQGIRHGILSAFGIKDKTERETANLNRAMETVQAALVSKDELLQEALDGKVVTLNINSISLVTPDWIRGGFGLKKMSHDNEQAQLKDQFKAWDGVMQRNPVTIQVMDKEGKLVDVQVNVNVNKMNFGVNIGAVGSVGLKAKFLSFFAFGAWKQVERENKEGLKNLLGPSLKNNATLGGSVGKFLADPNKTDEEKRIVTELAQQIREIWNSGAYRSEDHDPHKMVSRLAVLSHMLGETPCFNCKSGKDRTGVLDVEAKFLAARIALTGSVPPYGVPLKPEESEMYRLFSVNSGNLEMQQYNTGFGGFKNQLLGSTKERLGHDEGAMRFHKGGSSFVHT